MSRVMPFSLPGLLVLCVSTVLLLPGGAEARESRATEILNAANGLAKGEVRVVEDHASNRRAYAYKMNGRERVSVAAPRRVERQPQRVQRSSRRLDEIERSHARRQVENDAKQARRAAEALQDAASEEVTILPAVHRPTARERAEAAVHRASRRHHLHRDVHRKTYAGYAHKPRSRAAASLHYRVSPKHHRHSPKLHHRSHRHRGHAWYDLPVSVRHHYHYSSRHRHRFGTSIGVHLGSRRSYCPPLRSHYRSHHRKGGRFSIHLDF